MKSDLDRRGFLGAAVAGAAALAGRGAQGRAGAPLVGAPPPAILGGTPVRREAFPSWPVADVLEERSLVDVLKSGAWYRVGGRHVDRFESAYADLMGSKHCLATANGTSALLTSLHALGVGPGDEVILPPYTFVATVNVVLLLHALPVFVDTDLETFQIDAGKVEAAVTERTRVLLPVHLPAPHPEPLAALDHLHERPLLQHVGHRPGREGLAAHGRAAEDGGWRGADHRGAGSVLRPTTGQGGRPRHHRAQEAPTVEVALHGPPPSISRRTSSWISSSTSGAKGPGLP